jgi:Tol biopolymer transport system component
MGRSPALVFCLALGLAACRVQVSPPVSRIMHLSDQEAAGVNDIMVMRENGSGLKNLTASILPGVSYLDLSSDGTKIVVKFSSDNRPYIMNGDGTNPEPVTDAAVGSSFPLFSPDSRKIALKRGEFLYYFDLGDRDNLVSIGTFSTAMFAWSPDSTHIVYASPDNGAPTLFNYSLETGTSTELVPGTLPGDDQPSWSPDGKYIFFKRMPFAGAPGQLWRINVRDPSDCIRLAGAPDGCYYPAVSPQGTRLAFICQTNPDPVEAEIGIINSDGSVFSLLTANRFGSWGPLVWSPDGSRILFQAHPNGLVFPDIFMVSVDDKKLENLTQSPTINETNPVWRSR